MQAIINGEMYEVEPAVKVILDRVMIENAELKRENKRLEEAFQKATGVIAATDCAECKDKSVSKQSVIDYLNGYLHSIGEDNLFDSGQRRALTNAIQDISAIKAADVQSVKHGRWLDDGGRCRCSECSERSIEDFDTPYCQWCGAKMDLKDGENNE